MVEVPSSNLGSPTKHKKGPLNSGPFLCLVGYVRKEPLRQIAPAIWTTFRSPVGSKVIQPSGAAQCCIASAKRRKQNARRKTQKRRIMELTFFSPLASPISRQAFPEITWPRKSRHPTKYSPQDYRFASGNCYPHQ